MHYFGLIRRLLGFFAILQVLSLYTRVQLRCTGPVMKIFNTVGYSIPDCEDHNYQDNDYSDFRSDSDARGITLDAVPNTHRIHWGC